MAHRPTPGHHYGQANPGPIGPTRKVVSTPERDIADRPLRLGVKNSGDGPVVTDVSWSADQKNLVVSRQQLSASSANSSTRFAEVMHDVSHVSPATAIPDVTHWVEFDGNGDPIPATRVLLPEDFEHADGFDGSQPWVSNLPPGLAWARLGVGSDPIGEASWDADVLDLYVEKPDQSDAPKKPSLMRAYAVGDEVTLVFNVPVTPPDRLYAIQKNRFRFISSKTTKYAILSVVSGTAPNTVVVTLDSTPVLDERLSVQLDTHAVRSAEVPGWASPGSFTGVGCRASSVVPVIPRYPRNCYVAILNRALGGGAIVAGTKVILGATPTTIRDDDGIEYPVYDAIPFEGGGDVATMAYLPATVVERSLGAPVDHFYTVTELPEGDPLAPTTWEDFELPITFEHGDPLPTVGLPPQIGWVRMRYPSENKFGTNGKAGEDKDYGSEADPTVVTYLIRAELKGGTELTLWFNERTWMRSGPPFTKTDLNDRMTITHSVVGGPTIEVESVVAGDKANKYIVTISGATPEQWNTIASTGGFKVSLLEVHDSTHPTIFYSNDGSGPGGFIANNIQSDFAGVFGDVRAAYLLVMNRVMDGSIPFGTALNVSLKSYVDIPEEADPTETRRIYDITPGSCVGRTAIGSVVGGVELFGTLRGIRYYVDSIEVDGGVTSAWEARITGSPVQAFQDGIGVVQVFEGLAGTNPYYVLAINDGATTEQPIDLPSGTPVVIRVSERMRLKVIGSSPEEYIEVYPVRVL